jgi:hypothetical protein
MLEDSVFDQMDALCGDAFVVDVVVAIKALSVPVGEAWVIEDFDPFGEDAGSDAVGKGSTLLSGAEAFALEAMAKGFMEDEASCLAGEEGGSRVGFDRGSGTKLDEFFLQFIGSSDEILFLGELVDASSVETFGCAEVVSFGSEDPRADRNLVEAVLS